MAGDGHDKFQNAAAQEPPDRTGKQGVGRIVFGEVAEDDPPNNPKNGDSNEDRRAAAPTRLLNSGRLTGLVAQDPVHERKHLKRIIGKNRAKNGKNSSEKEVGQKK